jgi:HK97 family phage major capsid protein
MTLKELKTKKNALVKEAREVAETRELDAEAKDAIDSLMAQIADLSARIEALESLEGAEVAEDRDDEAMEEGGKKDEERSFKNHPAVVRSRGRVSAATVHEHAKNERYSLGKAINEWTSRERLSGVEAEVDQELSRGGKSGSFRMPMGDIGKLNKRDLNLTTGTGAIPTYWEKDFIDYLYPIMVGPQLGFTYMSGLAAGTKLPRQNAVPTVAAVAESAAASGSNPTLDNVTLTAHQISANVTVSRLFIQQAVVQAESFVQNTLAKQVAVTMDSYALNGTGNTNQPTGLFNNSAVTNLVYATTNALSWADTVNLEKLVAESNANMGRRAYLTSPAVRAKLRTTVKVGTFPVFLIDDKNQINGYDVVDSTQVPKTFSYCGTSSLSALVYGNWEELIVATFGNSSVDILVDPYTSSTKGDVVITAFLAIDTNVMHGGSFAICPNVSVA